MRRIFLVSLALSAACGGEVEVSPAPKNPPGWPDEGCPPAFELREERCQVREVYVPGGTFVMGRGFCPVAGALQEPPDFGCPLRDAPQEVTVPPFWVEAAVATNATTAFDTAPDCPGSQIECAKPTAYLPVTGGLSGVGSDGLDGVDHECMARGKLHLTEVQWEFIATWGGTRTYPWGEDEPTCELANIDTANCPPQFTSEGRPGLARAMSYPPSPEGIYDLIGNAGEYVSESPEVYTPTYTALPIWLQGEGPIFALRGGIADGPPKRFESAFRGVNRGAGPTSFGGGAFRCARPAD